MDADLFGPKKKPDSAPPQAKGLSNLRPAKEPSKAESPARVGGAGKITSFLGLLVAALLDSQPKGAGFNIQCPQSTRGHD